MTTEFKRASKYPDEQLETTIAATTTEIFDNEYNAKHSMTNNTTKGPREMKIYAVEVVGEYTKENPHLGTLLAVLKADHEVVVKALKSELEKAEKDLELEHQYFGGEIDAHNKTKKELARARKDYQKLVDMNQGLVEALENCMKACEVTRRYKQAKS